MRKVKNKKVIRRLANKSFRSNQTRNMIAVLAIALTTMLFTTIFTIGLGTIESFQLSTMRQSGGNCHGVFKNLTWEQYDRLKDHPSIKECAPCILAAEDIKNPEFLKRHVEAWYMPAYHYPHCFLNIIDGKAPEKPQEILMDDMSLQLLGLPAKAGQEVTLEMQLGSSREETTPRTFYVSGVLQSDPAFNVGFAIVSDAYLDTYADELTYTYDKDYSRVGAIRMDVNFSNSLGIQKNLDKVIRDCGYSTDETQKDYIESNANWAYISDGAEADPMTMAAMAAGLLLVLFTGYLIIYNVFQISVMKDIRYYGLLKTVGTTGRQVKKILRHQAIWLSVLGIPLGILAGFFIGKGIVPSIIASSAIQAETQVSFHPLILVGATLFSALTVSISIGKPSRIAAKVSPVEAVRYTDNTQHKKKNPKPKKSTKGGRISRMALASLSWNRGRTTVVIISLSLAIILLNSVFTLTDSFDMDMYLKRFSTFDVLIGNARYFGMDTYRGSTDTTIDTENLSDSFIDACAAQDGFQEAGRIYGSGRIGLDTTTYQAPPSAKQDENGNFYEIIKGIKIEYKTDQDGILWDHTFLYGLDDLPLRTVEVWKGETDPEKIRAKLSTGKYILCGVQTDDNDVPMEEKVMHLPGDQITLVQPDGTKRQFEVLSLIKINYYGISCRRWEAFAYYTTSDIFREMESDKYLMSCAIDVADDKETDFVQFVEQYTTTQEPLMSYESKQTYLKEFSKMTDLFILIGGVLSFVIGMIGILNFINTILTGIVSRQKEFAMMEAIGMTKRQLTRMLILEGLYYAGITIAASLTVGCLFSLTVVRVLADGIWFMQYHFVLGPMLAVYPFLLVLSMLIPYLVYLPQRKMDVVYCLTDN